MRCDADANLISQLRLFHFRNFAEQSIDFCPGANIFVGHNGQGKSNILEAIYLLFTGESFRPATSEHLIQNGFDACSVTAFLQDESQVEDKVVFKIIEGRKSLSMNEKKISRRDLLQKQPITLFSPESLNAIKGSADERRRLVDELALFFQPAKEAVFTEFRKALRMRNQILRDFKAEKQGRSKTEQLLGAVEGKFLTLSSEVTALRLNALKLILEPINIAMGQISSGFPPISFQYLISDQDHFHSDPKEIHNSMQKRAQELLSAELATGHSLVGPQRHDLVFLFGGKDSRFYSSQGQQRSLILAFKLAQIVYHRRAFKKAPILLLDDVLSELDGEKRKSFVELIKNMETQIVITTTDFDLPQVFDSARCAVKRVQNGQLS